MIHKKIENLIKKLLPINRYLHRKICAGTSLSLDYASNKEGIPILEAIFIHREYADYFPMQQEVVIVDIGAHYGYFSLFAALNVSEKSKIFSLEPSPSNFPILEKNIQANRFSNIQLFNLGLDNQSGERQLSAGVSYNHSFFGPPEKENQTVSTLSLKDFIQEQNMKRIDFLKLDCEGAEFPILLAADADDLAIITTISMEFHDLPEVNYTSLQLLQHLKNHGFEIVKYHHDSDYSFSNLSFGKIIATKAP